MKNLLIIILSLLLFSSSNAEILKTKDPKALCSNGKQATFNFYENKSNNWLIYFQGGGVAANADMYKGCLLYTSPSPRDRQKSRMPSSA